MLDWARIRAVGQAGRRGVWLASKEESPMRLPHESQEAQKLTFVSTRYSQVNVFCGTTAMVAVQEKLSRHGASVSVEMVGFGGGR